MTDETRACKTAPSTEIEPAFVVLIQDLGLVPRVPGFRIAWIKRGEFEFVFFREAITDHEALLSV
jgi:hypothetical protein